MTIQDKHNDKLTNYWPNATDEQIVNGFDLFEEDDDEDDEDDEGFNANRNHSSFKSRSTNAKRNDSGHNDHDQQGTKLIDKYGSDLTQAAKDGKLDPVVGRNKELDRMMQTLSRRRKNNPILVGDPGVGKTAIVEGLAQRIVNKDVPHTLMGKRIISLDMSAIVAGTVYRGQFEERIVGIIKELKANPDIIIFIDEIHTIIGAGSTNGSGDASNIMKPALARGELRCIGSTTIEEYNKHFEKDGALERRFQKIMVDPTTPDETLEILQQVKTQYENHHHVIYTEEALQACVRLTDRYISDRFLPDKAIDALDEAGSRAHIQHAAMPAHIEEQAKKKQQAQQQKLDALAKQNFELAAHFRDEEKALQGELEQMERQWQDDMDSKRHLVDEDNVAEVVSMMSSVPVQRVEQGDNLHLITLKEKLKASIVGQDEAIDTIVRAIQRGRVGLKDPNRPIGSFLFLGPTGVGKTYLAKELARLMFGSANAMIRIDMSEYSEKFAVSRMVGAPPGYVGFDEGGQLTDQVRHKPYSIILLDEIEKADPEVLNILLQVMDDGRLTDSNGRMVDFRNTVLIMTSNVGSRRLKDFSKGIGFATDHDDSQRNRSNSIINKSLSKAFSPEFLNRIDEIVNFNPLEKEHIQRIVDIELDKLYQRIQPLGIELNMDEQARQFLAEKGYDHDYGARPLRRAIQTYVEDVLANLMLEQKITAHAAMLGTLANGQLVIETAAEHLLEP